MNHDTPATTSAEYTERTRDENKQRELHPADMGNIDLDTFQAMSADGRRAVWFAASDADRRGLALAIIRRAGRGPSDELIATYLGLCEQRFGSDLAMPAPADIVAAADERANDAMARGDDREAARYGRVVEQLARGARLCWSSGRLLIRSSSGHLYTVESGRCDCPNSRSSSPSCWHLPVFDLLLDMADDRAAAADILADAAAERAAQALDEAEARRELARRMCEARSRIAA
jgi:hypothetical protein